MSLPGLFCLSKLSLIVLCGSGRHRRSGSSLRPTYCGASAAKRSEAERGRSFHDGLAPSGRLPCCFDQVCLIHLCLSPYLCLFLCLLCFILASLFICVHLSVLLSVSLSLSLSSALFYQLCVLCMVPCIVANSESIIVSVCFCLSGACSHSLSVSSLSLTFVFQRSHS